MPRRGRVANALLPIRNVRRMVESEVLIPKPGESTEGNAVSTMVLIRSDLNFVQFAGDHC